MGENSKIEWCKHTVNIWWGCTEVHEGCDNCYARILSNRYKKDLWGNDKPRMLVKSAFDDLDRFQKLAEKAGEKHRVFINSMSDIFERAKRVVNWKGELLPKEFTTGTFRDVLFKNISEGRYPNLILLLLTKRPSNISRMIPIEWTVNGAPDNVMFGTSPVNQATADKLIPQLCSVNGKRFLSIEPQLGPIDLFKEYIAYEPDYDAPTQWRLIDGINWGINGGESGPKKRPYDVEWGRSLRDQFAKAGVPFFMKQIDKVKEIPEDLLVRQFTG